MTGCEALKGEGGERFSDILTTSQTREGMEVPTMSFTFSCMPPLLCHYVSKLYIQIYFPCVGKIIK